LNKKLALLGRSMFFYVSLLSYLSVEICRFHFVDRVELNTLRPVGVGLIFVYIHRASADPLQSRWNGFGPYWFFI